MEPDVSSLLSVQRAIEILDAEPLAPRATLVDLPEALGLRLRSDVIADRDYPPFDKSQMDGFAVRSTDFPTSDGGEHRLRLVGEIAAGQRSELSIEPGTCAKIFTGAAMPRDADAVIPVEFTTARDGAVTLRAAAEPGRFVAPRGSDCRAGDVVLRRGSVVTPAAIAVAASVGAWQVQAFARPRVAVISSGDELVAPGATPGPSQIRDSNQSMLVALLSRLGCDARGAGSVCDDPGAIRKALEAALRDADVLLVSGGMSMGDRDHVPRVLGEMGADLKITKLRIKPGKPFVFAGLSDGKYVFGLPGNPVSGFACTLRLVSRLLTRLAGGEPRDAERWRHATLDAPLPSNGPREFYQPARLADDGSASPLRWKGSADVYTLAAANALLVRAENEPALPVGARVRLLEIPS
jgi:molybdopterin molybdotransferase